MRNFAIKLIVPPPDLVTEQNPNGLKFVDHIANVSAAQGFVGFYDSANRIIFAAPLANILYFYEF